MSDKTDMGGPAFPSLDAIEDFGNGTSGYHVIVGALEVDKPKPECRKQWTPDARYVRHCNFHNGRGWVVTP